MSENQLKQAKVFLIHGRVRELPIEKNSETLSKDSLKSKESNKKMALNSELERVRTN